MTVRPDLHVGDFGTDFDMVVLSKNNRKPIDLTNATLVEIKFKPPTAASFKRTATVVSATAGTITYEIADGDLTESGRWQAQVYVEEGVTGKWHSDIEWFDVGENIAVA